MTNKWIEHIQKYAKEHNTTFSCALSNPDTLKSYQNSKKLTNTPRHSTPVKNIEDLIDDIKLIQQSYPIRGKGNQGKAGTKFRPALEHQFIKLTQEYKTITGKDYGEDIQRRPNTKEEIKRQKEQMKMLQKDDASNIILLAPIRAAEDGFFYNPGRRFFPNPVPLMAGD